jgi:hypothetical protein
MPFYQVVATVHHEAQCVIEANDSDHAVTIATALSGMDYEEFEKHFNKHIVNTCNTTTDDKVKSCRKLSRKYVKTRYSILSRKR